jgi:hypothetical protein
MSEPTSTTPATEGSVAGDSVETILAEISAAMKRAVARLAHLEQILTGSSPAPKGHNEDYEKALQEAQTIATELRQAGDISEAEELESDLERIIAWADGAS